MNIAVTRRRHVSRSSLWHLDRVHGQLVLAVYEHNVVLALAVVDSVINSLNNVVSLGK